MTIGNFHFLMVGLRRNDMELILFFFIWKVRRT